MNDDTIKVVLIFALGLLVVAIYAYVITSKRSKALKEISWRMGWSYIKVEKMKLKDLFYLTSGYLTVTEVCRLDIFKTDRQGVVWTIFDWLDWIISPRTGFTTVFMAELDKSLPKFTLINKSILE